MNKTKKTNETRKIKVYKEFDDMNLKDGLLKGIYSYGFEKPSIIQQKGIMPVVEGRDSIIQAQSGSGKTATFSIASLQIVDKKTKYCQVLIISPTRELARQSFLVVSCLGEHLNIPTQLCIGGTRISEEYLDSVSEGSIIAGTPGRIMYLIKENVINLSNLKLLVLDEADEMLSQGFKSQIKSIFEFMEENVQVAIYSATYTPDIIELTKQFMKNPVKILIKKENLTLDGIQQYYVDCGKAHDKLLVIQDIYKNIPKISQSIIFCNSRKRADWLKTEMEKNGFVISLIHGQLEQEERNDILKSFKKGSTRVLVTTDLLARGIDVHQLSLVINYELPKKKENYIHRIGRSGRYGKKGVAINLITKYEKDMINELIKFYETTIDFLPQDFKEIL